MTPTLLLAATLAYPLCDVAYPPGTTRRGVAQACLVDVDTGWHKGRKWRLQGVDGPERGDRAECAAERRMDALSTATGRELLSGGYTINWTGQKGGMQRDLVTITLSDGRDYGEVLMSMGYAVPWPHPPGVWCL